MIEYTGERVIPALMKPTNGLLLEHIARYHFAIPYAKGRVLDFACGSGFGSNILAKARKKEITELFSIDIAEEAICYAKANYYHPLIHFQQGDVTDPTIPDKLGQFDLIVSFETLEHIELEEQFIHNIYRLLKPGGKLVISTPFGQGRGKPTSEPFHVHQLTVQEFHSMFDQYQEKLFYYQKGVLVEPGRNGIHYPMGIAVCTK
ncbi:class I SAM-dependent methyltransferase [Mesobacillus maritimus]|uniref:class I SAM-dependent methyltransferase n=1 Tax=Mesobacillus maritimus TaxID=1643336 RepID=UPI0020416113|nr:class I SAM-dependent methyltransferase [Mesobacillus maritimus]MCM3588061.1 class I SAM-dependent methyltransferase [Mesobacillus maritimus]MCM3668392.1 class I SAM-dependent methyltransferase [Mesobacillus maritimus]